MLIENVQLAIFIQLKDFMNSENQEEYNLKNGNKVTLQN